MDYNNEYEAIKLGELVAKEIQGQLSEEDAKLLKDMLDRSTMYRQVYHSLQQKERKKLLERIGQYDASSALVSVIARAEQPRGRTSIRKIWYAAASIILLFSIATITYLQIRDQSQKQIITSKSDTDILPGQNRAYITLADGTHIALDSGQTTIENREGVLVYGDGRQLLAASETAYATINTPVGGQYQIVLPDGTKVWLNASSELKYPLQFTGEVREVELSGEAYFEVKSSIKSDTFIPFTVVSAGDKVTVLGTSFNIDAYPESPIRRTTLVEGKIQLDGEDGKQYTLKPGQQWVGVQNESQIVSVPVEDFVAWKDGLFSFNEDNLKTIMERIARWYNVEVVFDGVSPDLHFGGTISKYSDLKEVLSRLELTGKVKFEIKGRRVIVRS